MANNVRIIYTNHDEIEATLMVQRNEISLNISFSIHKHFHMDAFKNGAIELMDTPDGYAFPRWTFGRRNNKWVFSLEWGNHASYITCTFSMDDPCISEFIDAIEHALDYLRNDYESDSGF